MFAPASKAASNTKVTHSPIVRLGSSFRSSPEVP